MSNNSGADYNRKVDELMEVIKQKKREMVLKYGQSTIFLWTRRKK